MEKNDIVSLKSAQSWKSAHPLHLAQGQSYSNEHPPWSKLHMEFEKHSLKHIYI